MSCTFHYVIKGVYSKIPLSRNQTLKDKILYMARIPVSVPDSTASFFSAPTSSADASSTIQLNKISEQASPVCDKNIFYHTFF